VRAEHHAPDAAHFAREAREQRADFPRRGVAHGIGDVHRRRAGLDHRRQRFDEEFRLRADRVLGREFDVVAQLARTAHRRKAGFQHLPAAHAELVLAMDRAGGEEDVDARVPRLPGGARDRFDVRELRAGEAADHRTLDIRGNCAYGFEIAVRRTRKPCLDHVDAELGECLRNAQLLRAAHRKSRCLLAIAQGGVEHADAFAHGYGCCFDFVFGLIHVSACAGMGHKKTPPRFPGAGFWMLCPVLLDAP
jgi:hypothetical protein